MPRTLSAAQASRQDAVAQTSLTVMAGKQKGRFTGKLWGSAALLCQMIFCEEFKQENFLYNRSSGLSVWAGFAHVGTMAPCVVLAAGLHGL